MLWKSFLPTLKSKNYEEKVLEIHNFIIKEALLLPNPDKIKMGSNPKCRKKR